MKYFYAYWCSWFLGLDMRNGSRSIAWISCRSDLRDLHRNACVGSCCVTVIVPFLFFSRNLLQRGKDRKDETRFYLNQHRTCAHFAFPRSLMRLFFLWILETKRKYEEEYCTYNVMLMRTNKVHMNSFYFLPFFLFKLTLCDRLANASTVREWGNCEASLIEICEILRLNCMEKWGNPFNLNDLNYDC